MSLLIVGSTALDSIKTPKAENPRLLGGSGSYAGIRGTLTITVSGRGILPTSSSGACEKGGSAPPLVAVSTASGSGSVSF